MVSDLCTMSATGLAKRIRDKDVSSSEVIEAQLERIDNVNGSVNAVTAVLREQALAAAEAADRAQAEGTSFGPLHGVPITVKENIDLAGSATTQGVLAMAEAVPPDDAPHIKQLKAAGAIPIARTNLPDFGLRWHTDNALRGATRNPWDPSLSPGGSSGGEAAALVTGMSPLGMGNDYGGSVRIPSQWCGTTALRPTLGRVPDASYLAPDDFPITIQLYAVQGPMARHVHDLRLALHSMSGPDARDPWWTPVPLEGPPPNNPARVAMMVDPAGEGVDSEVAAGVQRAADALRDAGYMVEDAEPPLIAEARDTWASQVVAEIKIALYDVIRENGSDGARRFLEGMFDVVPDPGYAGYVMSFARRATIARQWSQFFERYDLVLGPVATMQPFPADYDLEHQREVLDAMRLVVTVNLLGLPAVAVPAGPADGRPQGVQVIGNRYREDVCLDAAEAIEARLGRPGPIDPL